MMTADHPGTGAAVARPELLPVLKGTAGLFAGLMLVQAILGGRGWFVDRDLIAIHGGVGGAVVLVAALQAVLALLVGAPAGVRRQLAPLTSAILLLVAVQYGLGFASRDSATAGAWHVPNGVLIFGLATATTALIVRLGR